MNLLLSDPAFLSAAAISGGYDPDAAAYIARVEGASGDNQALETAVKDAINAFVVGCKADGIWNAIKASAILAGARTLNGALQPLAGTAPTNNNFVAGDYNRKTGLVGNGGTKYLDTGRADNANGITSKHFGVYVTTNATFDGTIIGNNVSTYGAGINLRTSGQDTQIFFNTSTRIDVLTAPTPFFIGVNRNGTAVNARSGTNTSSNTSTAVLDISANNFVFARNNGTAANNFSASRLAFYSIGESLDLALLDARVTTLINAFAAAIP